MELIDLIPNSLSFRVITTIDIRDEAEIPQGFSGRVKFHEDDYISYVAWYTDGQLNNPGRHHPAYRRFRRDGRLKYEMYYAFGLLHDPSDTEPAVRGYYADGKVHYEERYFGGKHGVAAIRKWRHDGELRHELRYRAGRRTDVTIASKQPDIVD